MEEKFSCPSCGVRFSKQEAAKAGYRCPECGDDLQDIEVGIKEESLSTNSGAPTTTKAKTALYAALAICALAIFFILAKNKVSLDSQVGDSLGTQTIEETLEKARNLNLKTPIMVDKSTRLDLVMVEDLKIVFQSTLLNPEAEKRAGEEEVKIQVRQSLVKKYCENEETRTALQLGITYGHEYLSPDGKLLFTASITQGDCL